jgi:hypothetical protein
MSLSCGSTCRPWLETSWRAEDLERDSRPFTVADLDGKLPDEIVVEHNNLGQSSLVVYTSQSLLDFEATTIAPIAMSPVTFEVVDLTEDGALDVLIYG